MQAETHFKGADNVDPAAKRVRAFGLRVPERRQVEREYAVVIPKQLPHPTPTELGTTKPPSKMIGVPRVPQRR
jgi:hypothetical protein